MTRSRTHLLAVPALLVAATMVLSCSSSKKVIGSPTAAAPTTSSTSGATTAPPTSAATTSGSAAPTTTATTAATPCKAAGLKADFQLQSGIDGQGDDEAVGLLALTNTTSSACSINGYPTLGAHDVAGMPMPITSVSVPQPGPPIAFDVPAGATAFAGANFKITGTGDACTKADVLTVALPGDTATVQTPFGAVDGGGQTASPMICGNKINVGSLQPASQGVLFA